LFNDKLAGNSSNQRDDAFADTARMDVDFLEAVSSGPLVILVHSSVSGARQWRRLKDPFGVRAVNLFVLVAVGPLSNLAAFSLS
jgi:hypothetical protein